MKDNEECIPWDKEKYTKSLKNFKWHWYNQLSWLLRRGIWEYIRYIPKNISNFVHRGIHGWAPCDVWSLDMYISKVLKNGLIHLKDHSIGHPADITLNKWEKILSSMIYTFDLCEKIADGDVHYMNSHKFDVKQYRETKKRLDDINKNLGVNNRVMTRRESIRFEQGFKLLEEYFFHLWD